MNATLLMIDWQKALDHDTYTETGQPHARENAARLLAHWREQGAPIVHLRHDSMDPDSPFAPETPGNDFLATLAPLTHEPVIEKRTNNGFIGTDLMAALEEFGSSDLVVCGALLENSVESTVRMAGNLGFMVYLIGDACPCLPRVDASGKKWSADDVHALTLAILNGEYAKVLQTEALVSSATTDVGNHGGTNTLQ